MAGFWTDERVEHLKKLVAEGHSFSVIHVILGAASRSAVIGKAFRLKLSTRASTEAGKLAQLRRQLKRRTKTDGSKTGLGSVRHVSNGKNRSDRILEAIRAGKDTASIAAETGATLGHISWVKCAALPDAEIDPILDVAAKPLLELEAGDCRWPVGTPGEKGFGFCAKPKHDGSSYCAGHAKRAHQLPSLRHSEPAPVEKKEPQLVH